MKNTTIITMAALLLGASGLSAETTAFTKPSGFVTHTLKAGQYNLIGLTLHEAVTVTGSFTAVSGTTLTDSNVDFGAVLTSGDTYVLEITNAGSANLNGMSQEFSAWTGNDITLGGEIQGLASGDTYQIRRVPTVSDVFGANNTAGLQASSNFAPAEADVIYASQGNTFIKYYYSDNPALSGWFDSTGQPAGDAPLIYLDSLLILRRGNTDLNVVFTGTVKTITSSISLEGASYNYVSTVFPVGSTLGNSGLENGLTATPNFVPTEADWVYIPDGAGGYDIYFYSTLPGATGWFKKAGATDATNVALTSGVIIYRRGDATGIKIDPPSGYSGL